MTERISIADEKNTGSREISRLIRLPKNIKQIGQGDPSDRIYIEDYVVTFIRVMHFKNVSAGERRSYFILAGSRGPVQGITATFISGAVMLDEEDVPVRKGIFTNETWEKIYGTLKAEFDSLEIVGWAIGDEDWDGVDNEVLKLHLQNFPGSEKLLYVHDTGNGEDNIYHYTGNNLHRCRGYYIYYEKNDAMQSYMLKVNGSKSIENEYVDETVQKIRAVSTRSVPLPGTGGKRGRAGRQYTGTGRQYAETGRMHAGTGRLSAVTGRMNAAEGGKRGGRSGAPAKRGYVLQAAVLASLLLVMAIRLNNDNPFSKSQKDDGQVIEQTLPPSADKSERKNSAVPANADGKDNKDGKADPDGKDNSDETTSTDPDNADHGSTDVADPDNADHGSADGSDDADKTGQEASASASKTYVVKKGDTLAKISYENYGTIFRVEDIMKLNGIADGNKIMVGDELKLP